MHTGYAFWRAQRYVQVSKTEVVLQTFVAYPVGRVCAWASLVISRRALRDASTDVNISQTKRAIGARFADPIGHGRACRGLVCPCSTLLGAYRVISPSITV